MSAWHDFVARYAVGDTIEARVVRPVPFGALIEVAGGVPGLLVAEFAGGARPEAGSRIPVRISRIDTERERVAVATA
ncbi:S1 RNA-binding domain-containing protein [Rhizomonospora bruguierae]|uniref:S1 RNA-binding domain-containing protein n=1 Tax=Rhizomonospora bruguierae TaxID=1581705 RepID=UPI001BCF4ADF|nr:S1 RNA-binding domain-containing protein [Micromonospora sp. NBRC 107566]